MFDAVTLFAVRTQRVVNSESHWGGMVSFGKLVVMWQRGDSLFYQLS